MSNVMQVELSADRTGLSPAFKIWATDASSILYSVAATEVSGNTINAIYTGTVPSGLSAGAAYPVTLEDGTTRYASGLMGWDGTNIVDPATVLTASTNAATAASSASTAASNASTAASAASSAVTAANSAAGYASTAATNTASILAKLGAITGIGLNTVLGYFRALASSLSGINPSDLTSGTSYDNTAYSLQAIAGAIASERASPALMVIPASSVVSSGEVRSSKLVAYQYSALGPYNFTISDQTGAPLNLSGHAITFVVHDGSGNYLWEVTGCTVGGPFNNLVTVSQGTANTSTAGGFRYTLRDTTSNTVIARGELLIDVAANYQ